MNNYRYEIEQIRDQQSTHDFDLFAQIVLLGIAVTAAWLVIGLWQLPVWFVIAYSIVGIERYLHKRPNQNYSKQLYYSYLALSFIVASTASFLPLFVWFQGGEPYHFGVMAYLLGAILNTFIMRSRSWQLMMCYLIPNAIVLCAIAITYFVANDYSVNGMIMLLIAALISIYYGVSVFHAVQRYQKDDETKEQLFRAQKIETLGNLAGGIAHDFNNILGIMSGNLELLRHAKTQDEREELIAQALSATDRGAGLVRQLLAFGRQSSLMPEVVDIHRFLSELHIMAERLVPSYIDLQFSTDNNLTRCWIDESTLQATLINLITNARDAMQTTGEIKVSTQLKTVSAEGLETSTGQLVAGQYIEFVVSDSGAGISPELFGRVLEPFYTTKEVGEGTGLGLSMVAGFARQCHGGVTISSEPDEGTEVSLIIPLIEQPNHETLAASTAIPSLPTSGKTPRILIVEDEPKLREVLELHLNREGFPVKAVKNGDHAMDVIRHGFEPDLVLSDIVMPGNLQGVELVQALQPVIPNAKFIMMTGYSYSKEAALNASNFDYSLISKPFKLTDLTTRILSLASSNPRTH
ncbi:MAG: ATP-binding protein [Woeseiaceae bacterium]